MDAEGPVYRAFMRSSGQVRFDPGFASLLRGFRFQQRHNLRRRLARFIYRRPLQTKSRPPWRDRRHRSVSQIVAMLCIRGGLFQGFDPTEIFVR